MSIRAELSELAVKSKYLTTNISTHLLVETIREIDRLERQRLATCNALLRAVGGDAKVMDRLVKHELDPETPLKVPADSREVMFGSPNGCD